MNVFFDIDRTIQGEDGTLRPGTRELFTRLVEEGHRVYVWSGMGLRHADIRRHELEHLVTDVYHKPVTSFADGLKRFSIPVVPDFIVDDYPGIVEFFGGHLIREYWAYLEQPDDCEMTRVYEAFREHCDADTAPEGTEPALVD
jgi:hypothetical protein